MGTKDFKLGPLVFAGYMHPGERALSCSVSGVEHFADLGDRGQIIYNGEVFHSPSAFSVHIKRLQNPKRMADDGWTSVKYRGEGILTYRDMLKNLLQHDKDQGKGGGGGGTGYGGSALTASPMRTSLVSRPSRRPKRRRHGSFEESVAVSSSPETSDWDRSGAVEVNGPSKDPGDEEWQGPVSKRARGSSRLTPAPSPQAEPEVETVDEATIEAANFTWIQCEEKSCQKWRKVDPLYAENRDKPWICNWNPDQAHGSCDVPQERETQEVFQSIHMRHMLHCTRPPLAIMTDEEFQQDLCKFLVERNEGDLAKQLINKRVTCNNFPLDIFNLYRQVMFRGGFEANEDYDAQGRWKGRINFAGEIFKKLTNYTENNKATSVGNQLMSNYKKFLLAYERAHGSVDLPERMTAPGSNAEGLELLGLAATDFAAQDDIMGTDSQIRGGGGRLGKPPRRYDDLMLEDSRRQIKQREPATGSRTMQLLMKLEANPERVPGTLLLAQDLHNPLMYWPVMVASVRDLPREVVCEGAVLSPAQPPFPQRLDQILSGRLETCYPVMVLGTESMGWVEAASCRAYNAERAFSAINSVTSRLSSPQGEAEASENETRFRALKIAAQYEQLTDTKQATARAWVQAAGVHHVARNLLVLEGRLPANAPPGGADFNTWHDWRKDVEAAHTPAQLARLAFFLHSQLQQYMVEPQRSAVVTEIMPFLGVAPVADGTTATPTVVSVDDAISVLSRSVDWDNLRKPTLSGMAQSNGGTTDAAVRSTVPTQKPALLLAGVAQASPAPTEGEGLHSQPAYNNGLVMRHSGSATNLTAPRPGWPSQGRRTQRRPPSSSNLKPKGPGRATPEPPSQTPPLEFATSTPVQPAMADDDRVSDYTPRRGRGGAMQAVDDGAVCSPIADMITMTPTLKPIKVGGQDVGPLLLEGGHYGGDATGMEVELRPHPMYNEGMAATPQFSRRAAQPFQQLQPHTIPAYLGHPDSNHLLGLPPTLKYDNVHTGLTPQDVHMGLSPLPQGNMSSVTGSAEDAQHGSTDDDHNIDIVGSAQRPVEMVKV